MFTGLLNASLVEWLFIFIISISTALLICVENTFWNIGKDHDNFMNLLMKTFSLYVESGMREIMEVDIDILRNEQGEFLVTKDFKERFCKFITEHYLRKFHFFINSWNI